MAKIYRAPHANSVLYAVSKLLKAIAISSIPYQVSNETRVAVSRLLDYLDGPLTSKVRDIYGTLTENTRR